MHRELSAAFDLWLPGDFLQGFKPKRGGDRKALNLSISD
jgi:hypothetical protein